MTYKVTDRSVVSVFTLQVLEDSGWYKVNKDLAANYNFGKNKGC